MMWVLPLRARLAAVHVSLAYLFPLCWLSLARGGSTDPMNVDKLGGGLVVLAGGHVSVMYEVKPLHSHCSAGSGVVCHRLLLCCSKIAEAEAAVSVNEKKWGCVPPAAASVCLWR
jgi:hypothetical protein